MAWTCRDLFKECAGEGAAGLVQMDALSGGQLVFQITPIAYPHIERHAFRIPRLEEMLRPKNEEDLPPFEMN